MSAKNLRPLSRSVFELVGYTWSPVDAMVSDAIDLVPPGRAVRKYEQELSSRTKKRTPVNPRAVANDEKVVLGAKRVIESIIGSLRVQNHIEIKWEGDTRYVRRTPFTLAAHDVEPFATRLDTLLSGTDASLPRSILLMPASERKALAAVIIGALDPREEEDPA